MLESYSSRYVLESYVRLIDKSEDELFVTQYVDCRASKIMIIFNDENKDDGGGGYLQVPWSQKVAHNHES